jgi:hypothetical protein
MNPTLRGAVRSKTIWLNVLLAAVSALELSGAHLTTLWGPKVAAGVLLAGSMTNLVLRALTTATLAEKGGNG